MLIYALQERRRYAAAAACTACRYKNKVDSETASCNLGGRYFGNMILAFALATVTSFW
jgi:hypothetical protein